MNRGGPLAFLLFLVLAAQPLSAQSKAKAENVPEIPYDSVPNFLKLPPNIHLGEGIGVATNWRANPSHISTSYVERVNLTMRMANRRVTRLTDAFSKKFENHAHMVALYTVWYNWVRIYKTLRVTPAMAAGLTDRVWDMADVVKMIEQAEMDAMAETLVPSAQ